MATFWLLLGFHHRSCVKLPLRCGATCPEGRLKEVVVEEEMLLSGPGFWSEQGFLLTGEEKAIEGCTLILFPCPQRYCWFLCCGPYLVQWK